MQAALTSQRSQCWPVTPVLQKHWPVCGWHDSVPQGEQLHSARVKKYPQLYAQETAPPLTNLILDWESYFSLIYQSQSKDGASLLLDLLLLTNYSRDTCPGQIPFCEPQFGCCSPVGDEQRWEWALQTRTPEGAPAPLPR